MFSEIKEAALRNQSTLLQDGLGALSLVVMLVVALHLPSFF